MFKQKYSTKIYVILDKSGSMEICRDATINGFNEFLQQQRAEEPDAIMALTLFSSTATREYVAKPVHSAKPLTRSSYVPVGLTALYDAIGSTLTDAAELRSDEKALCVIITDGEENASKQWSSSDIKALISELENKGWTFIYLGANHDAWRVGSSLGIARGNTQTYDSSPVGTQVMFAAVAHNTTSYRSSSNRKTTSFFTDLSAISPDHIKQQLRDVRRQVAILAVSKEMPIKEFIESKGYTFAAGRAFYQLTKNEWVQSYKEIMIQEKGKRPVYAGAHARTMLGLPNHDTQVEPGNHANYDVFVQSHSSNRKLVRGTSLIYKL